MKNITDLGQSLQRGIYENFVMFEKMERYYPLMKVMDVYPGFDQFINDYENILETLHLVLVRKIDSFLIYKS